MKYILLSVMIVFFSACAHKVHEPCGYHVLKGKALIISDINGTLKASFVMNAPFSSFNGTKIDDKFIVELETHPIFVVNEYIGGEIHQEYPAQVRVAANCDFDLLRYRVIETEVISINETSIQINDGNILLESQDSIKEVALNFTKLKKRYSEMKLFVEGYTDQTRSSEYSHSLGLTYINRVANLLKSYGVKSSDIVHISYGKERPECSSYKKAGNYVGFSVKPKTIK